MSPQGMTIIEASEYLGISKSLLRKELVKHQLTICRIGSRVFIPKESLDHLITLSTGTFVPLPARGRRPGAGRPRKRVDA
jgi:excisionase family DNA binding protein